MADTPQRKGRLDLANFKKSQDAMIASSSSGWNRYFSDWDRKHSETLKDYTKEDIEHIINSGSLLAQTQLSRNYFYKDGFYKRIILYYATLLKYSGLLIPNPGYGKSLSTSAISKKYFAGVDFVENMNLTSFLTNCSMRVLIDGSYFGVIREINKNTFSVIDLPAEYCSSRFKDAWGNDIIEFDVSYFNTIIDETQRNAALATYPKEIVSYYKKYRKGNLNVMDSWMLIPTDIGICFQVFDGRPLFLHTIPATIDYDEAVETEKERDLEEIKKIIIQKIPHLTSDGTLLFEPDEAEEIHRGTVGMMKGNKNVSVLTTYADVDSIVSKTAADNASNNLEKMMNNIYYEAGTSPQIFAATGNLALPVSLQSDLSLMMILANKYSTFITNIVNRVYANANISFKYTILPISYYNAKEFIDNSQKLATSGYSLILPALALGLSQRDLGNVKDLENDVLKLGEKLIPPVNSNQMGAAPGDPGAPAKNPEDKAPKTVKNEESINKGGSKA